MTTMTSENYLIAICTLTDEGEQPTLARLAAFCGVSAPTMGEAARRLERDGLVRIEPRRSVELTAQGREIADTLLRRHRLIERWLTDGLGLDWATAHEEAHRLEHAVSPQVEERIAASLGFPTTCPHGNPIRPQTDVERRIPLVSLDGVAAGAEVRLRRISELAEDNHELMTFYETQGFRPGVRLRVRERGLLGGPLTVDLEGRLVAIGPEVARYLWVWPPGQEPRENGAAHRVTAA
ncbi:MAG TPA: metal-dependent transcriptional regulator [Dehalococcoidia bacterium]|nr:metal-dependent transcriptional regulator [Dehalococcoidia bacterium]